MEEEEREAALVEEQYGKEEADWLQKEGFSPLPEGDLKGDTAEEEADWLRKEGFGQ